MPRILLVTNDFPPTIGGIQSYLRDFVQCLDPADVVVFASTQDETAAAKFDADQPYTVVRYPRRMMLPTPELKRQMQELIRLHDIDVVWFGAAAPLAVLGGAAKQAGARKVVATTHGHEVGWSMLPGARAVLRRIGRNADVITYISEYTLGRFRTAFGPGPQWVHLPSGVTAQDFPFQPSDEEKAAAKRHFGLKENHPVIVCVSRLVPRKGQDQLIRAMPSIRREVPSAQLLIIGRGRYEKTLRELADVYAPHTIITSAKDSAELSLALCAGDVFVMPVRTRGGGLDVEGLGIVFLEAQAAGIPVVAGDSGGAPETVTSESGTIIDGTLVDEVASASVRYLLDADLRARAGAAGRKNVEMHWSWDLLGTRLREVMCP
ncbi:MAG: glycosyltransferase family 4 protein [Corynebacterium sp.]|nr:glycosyltransferase family 4 protein [Corynebacterium sp.]